MVLKDGVAYRDGWGKSVMIAGRTAMYPEYVYSNCGRWFERETGYYVRYSPNRGYYSVPISMENLISEEPAECISESN